MGLIQNKLQCVCVHGDEATCYPVQQSDSWCVIGSFWTTMELYGTEEEDLSDGDTQKDSLLYLVFS